MSSKTASIDLLVIALAVGLTCSLRFTGLVYVGPITMAVGLLVVFTLMRLRAQPASSIGLDALPPAAQLVRAAGRLLPWFGLAWLAGVFIGVALFGQPDTSSAISEMPDNTWLFLLDITLITWVLIAFGEEVVFRGFVLHRLLVLTGESRQGQLGACAIQAVWFGSLHASQGAAGMIITGFIGFAFAFFFLRQSPRSLWPLILVHGVTDSIVLVASRFFT